MKKITKIVNVKKLCIVLAVCLVAVVLCSFKSVLTTEVTPLIADSLTESKALKNHILNGEVAIPSNYKWWLFQENNNGLPRRFHTMDEPFIENPKYKGGDINNVSREGMDKLNMSGSAMFSLDQLNTMLARFNQKDHNKIYMFDFCQESKLFVNKDAVFYYGDLNMGNLGRTTEQIMNNETELKNSILNTKIDEYSRCDENDTTPPVTVEVDSVLTEKEVCDNYGINYIRIPGTDHVFPGPSAIDYFIQYVKNLPQDAYLHMHCSGGVSRTTIFMVIWDIMQNPTVSLDDIVARQCLYERAWLYQDKASDTPTYKNDLYKEKTDMIKKVYEYLMRNKDTNYTKSYAQFLAE